MRESEIERYLARRVGQRGGEVRKVRWIGRRNAPDRLVLLEYAFFAELKATGEKPTKAQLREHSRLRLSGLRVEVIDSFQGVDSILGEGR